MTKHRMKGFQKPISTNECRPLTIPVVKTITFDNGTGVEITCGWSTAHKRRRVAEDRAEAHINTKHGGRGVWL